MSISITISIFDLFSSSSSYNSNQSWAESQRVVGSLFKVVGSSLVLQNSLPPLINGNFEQGKTGWYFDDAGLELVTNSTQCYNGGSSCAMMVASSGNPQRLIQKITVTPWRTYHIRYYIKYTGLNTDPQTMILDDKGVARLSNTVSRSSNDQLNWTVVDEVFNSVDSTSLMLYIGVWGGHTGTMWIDDISAEEVALINVLRNEGAPIRIYDPTSHFNYTEGIDVSPITDPLSGGFSIYHTPPVPHIPATGSRLKDGQLVAIDAYCVTPSFRYTTPACMTEPGVFSWLEKNIHDLSNYFNRSSGLFFYYDEIRHMHSCARCAAKTNAAGELLAWNIQQVSDIAFSISPDAPLYVWSDMFDPYANAIDDYFDVEGTIAGSWVGLPPNMTIMNWNLVHLTQSLNFFAGRDNSTRPLQPHQYDQIIAGYYDSGDGATSAKQEIAAARGIPGIKGVMYTTWVDDYSQLLPYANAVRAAWAGRIKEY
eukprot:TRINITY_DN6163_c0_g2_i1.p1 TRINITY_DN6163_c0_g2~~TRINITY_DN6163_c0_g2_i1.p1  ORF type:complete len:492 (-),score=78.63 TRINITY_DN6163_c0_g2_i1:1095-2537(-)